MKSDYVVRRISKGDTPCVGTYYDICPESPDGTRVVYSRFESDEVPGPAKLVVAGLDGEDPMVVGDSYLGNGHVGLFPQWLDDERLLSQARVMTRDACVAQETRIVGLEGGTTETIAGAVRMYSRTNGLGLVLTEHRPIGTTPYAPPRELRIRRMADGKETACVTIEDAAALIPEPGRAPPMEQMSFMNSKWSPDGKRFSVVFASEFYRKWCDPNETARLKCLIAGEADGSGLQLLGDFGHHPLWAPDSEAAIAMRRVPEGGQDLVRYPVDGAPEVLIEQARGVHSHLRADQKTLIVDVPRYPTSEEAAVVRYDVASGEMEVLVSFEHREYGHETGHHVHPAPSMDGKRIYFNAQDGGVSQMYVLELGD